MKLQIIQPLWYLRPSTVCGLSDAQKGERVWASLGTLWLVMPHLAGASKIWRDARSCIDASFFNNNKSTVATQAVGI